MTRAYFSCDCESVMNDLFSTFSRYNGSLSLKSCCEWGIKQFAYVILIPPSLLSLPLSRFHILAQTCFDFSSVSLSLALPCFHCVLSLFLHPVLSLCLMLSPFPFALCKYRQLKACQWWGFFFSSLPHFWGHSFMAPTSTVVKPSRPQKLYNFSGAFKVIGASNM